MEYYNFEKLNTDNGHYHLAGANYPSMMKRQITKNDSNKLQPIFEAVTNAFESLDKSLNNNSITIRLFFSGVGLGGVRSLNSISISDTGHGILAEDLTRIKTLFDDSKGFHNFGSGRIQYLHYFEHIDFHSIYKDNEQKYLRRLVMSLNYYKLNKSVLWEEEPQPVFLDSQTGTTVSFFTLRNQEDKKVYDELTPKKLRKDLYHHYLGKLCLNVPNNPLILIEEYINGIHNESEDQKIDNDDVPSAEKKDSFKIAYSKLKSTGEIVKTNTFESFEINSFKLPQNILKKNEVCIMSKDEAVGANGLNFSFIEHSPIIDECYRLFLVSSRYFTSKDTDKRGELMLTNIEKLKKQITLFNPEPKDIIIEDIENNIVSTISTHYQKIKNSKEIAEATIKRLVDLYSLDEKKVTQIVSSPNTKPIDVFKGIYSDEAQEKAKKYNSLNDILNSVDDLNPIDKDFQNQLESKIKKVSAIVPEINRLELLNYTSKRKVVLKIMSDILDKRLVVQNQKENKNKDDSETLIHNVLFPKKSTDALSSNLWFLNEDYIHFRGISDTEFQKMKYNGESLFREDLTEEESARLNSCGQKRLTRRPDILLFPEERKCIIIELKGIQIPVSKYIDQVFSYGSLLREFAKPQYIIDEFFCYLIGEDFSYDDVKRTSMQFDYDFTKEYMLYEKDTGIYGGEKRGDAKVHFEILKYSTLLKRATLRNKIFTDKISTEHNSDGNY